MFHSYLCCVSVTSEGSSELAWSENIEEPQLEFDETGLELAAQEGKMSAYIVINNKWQCWYVKTVTTCCVFP